MCDRIREAMKPDADAAPLGGKGKTLVSDERFVGGKNVHKGKPEPKKHAVHALRKLLKPSRGVRSSLACR